MQEKQCKTREPAMLYARAHTVNLHQGTGGWAIIGKTRCLLHVMGGTESGTDRASAIMQFNSVHSILNHRKRLLWCVHLVASIIHTIFLLLLGVCVLVCTCWNGRPQLPRPQVHSPLPFTLAIKLMRCYLRKKNLFDDNIVNSHSLVGQTKW